MAPPKNQSSNETSNDEADFAQAFQELNRGERTATVLENQLSAMEAKIEALLAEAEQRQQEVKDVKQASTSKTEDSDKSDTS